MSEYTGIVFKTNGKLEFYNQSIDIDHPESDEDVETIPGGDVGVSNGIFRTIITITNVKSFRTETFDYVAARANGTIIDIDARQIGSTKKLKGQFRVRSAKVTNSGPGQTTIEELVLKNAFSPAPYMK